ncbi:BrnT family toxin [Methylobacterium sp. J-048]|uniref:BrnT family toxin n=1 Tax=Methylobacterium sp. J-048 TaxID=2836635 RepID=UPI001FBA109C|nr:BrnT family toxin [Methylobacterium sp. J-048]MCJ2060457.1 BrnT family toxin [Methylobacterium sp. J-048]
MGEDDRTAWDDRKNDLNVRRHGIDFAALREVFDGRFALTREDTRRDYGERRFNTLVALNGVILNVTFTPRNGKRRIVSARIANRRERQLYHARRQES